MKSISCDVLVCGGGTAGVAAALSAVESGASVVVALKGELGRVGVKGSGASCCGASEYGIPRFPTIIKENLFGEDLFQAIIKAGLGVTDRNLAKTLVEQIPKAAKVCDRWGVQWGGQGPYSLGFPLVHTVSKKLFQDGLVLEDSPIVDLLLDDDGVCIGAFCLNNQQPLLISAKATIVATGGYAGAFSFHVHPQDLTGDGHSLVLKAGGKIWNMEFAQIFPMTISPTRNLFHFWNEECMRNLYNNKGEVFLSKYLPSGISEEQCIRENISHAPFSTRDEASRYAAIAISKEIDAGNGTNGGGVYVDLRNSEMYIPEMQKQFLESRGVFPSSELIEIAMGYQCSSGGIEINEKGETGVPGLYAAGEVSAGMHGADRLGGNMLAAAVVWGNITGAESVKFANKRLGSSLNQETKRVYQKKWSNIKTYTQNYSSELDEAIQFLKTSASKHLLIVKHEKGLLKHLENIDSIRTNFCKNNRDENILQLIELENIASIGYAIGRSSLLRKESRGSFYREDYPTKNIKTPPKVSRISLDNGNYNIESIIVDPLWTDTEDTLSLSRWG